MVCHRLTDAKCGENATQSNKNQGANVKHKTQKHVKLV